MNVFTTDDTQELFNEMEALASAGVYRQRQLSRVLKILDQLTRKEEGLQFIYDHIEQIEEAGVFQDTSWSNPDKLVPTLVKGTLISGFPMIIYETVSELRMLKIAEGEWKHPDIEREQARLFLQEALISSFELIFQSSSEEIRTKLTKNEQMRLSLLFGFILTRMPLKEMLPRLAHEVHVISEQRPIKTGRLRQILKLVKDHVLLDGSSESEVQLKFFVDTLYRPTIKSKELPDLDAYQNFLKNASLGDLRHEAEQMGHRMNKTGLVSAHHVALVLSLTQKAPELLGYALELSSHGRAELERHQVFVQKLINNYVQPDQKQVVYGLSKLLNRNLLSRKAVLNAINKLLAIRLNPEIERRLNEGKPEGSEVSPKDLLCGGVIRLLGQPLGVGQGLNPTCQSARGLSMWSRHSPEKLLNMIIGAAVANKLKFRYEGDVIVSTGLLNEEKFDYKLDPVSVVLVPHLDEIYQKMMQKAQLKHPAQDPHVSVNPAFYGHWIQTGFISCYNALTNRIENYEHFVKLFYASFHPEYNGGYKLIYPLPLGIFITSSHAEFLGFHAISLLRVTQAPSGEWRAYFYNPNNEGRQNWGQNIVPTVAGNAEKHGESSLPFYQFVSRVYAFHYNSLEAGTIVEGIEVNEFPKVDKLARESWGSKYFWD